LKEPEDTEALQTLRGGFPVLDDFVANIEPGMWVATTDPIPPLPNETELGNVNQEVGEQMRSRLLALAIELESGSIVHHRALRVRQLNQLREQAISELRSHADTEPTPQLPGPEADQWIKWVCSLKEPENAEALQALRGGFARLDDFVASLEHDMWVAGPSSPARDKSESQAPPRSASRGAQRSDIKELEQDVAPQGPGQIEFATAASVKECQLPEGSLSSGGPQQPVEELKYRDAGKRSQPISVVRFFSKIARHFVRQDKSSFASETACEAIPAPTVSFSITQGLSQTWKKASLIPVGIASIMVLAPLGALHWKSSWNFAPSLRAIEGKASEPARGNSGDNISDQTALNDKRGMVLQDQVVVPTTAPTSMSPLHAGKEGDGSLGNLPPRKTNNVDPEWHPLRVAAPIRELPSSDESSTTSASTASTSNDTTVAPVPLAAQKALVPLGGAQGLVIHGSAPLYPAAARQAHIEGSVLLRAVIGKDGNASNLRVLSGHPQLIQAALNAVRQWRFTPYSTSGEPVDATAQIDVRFTLQDN
jgi:TonB family protein